MISCLLLLLSFSSGSILSLFLYLCIYFIGSLQQKVTQVVDWIPWHLLAQINESLGEMGNHVVHQVLSDGLTSLVKQISLLLSNLFNLGSVPLFLLCPSVCINLVLLLLFSFLCISLLLFLFFLFDQPSDLIIIFLVFLLLFILLPIHVLAFLLLSFSLLLLSELFLFKVGKELVVLLINEVKAAWLTCLFDNLFG